MKKILFIPSEKSHYLHKNTIESQKDFLSFSEISEKNTLSELVTTQRFLLELDTIAQVKYLGENKPSFKKNSIPRSVLSSHASKIKEFDPSEQRKIKTIKNNPSLILSEKRKQERSKKIEGIGIQNARIISVTEQLKLAKESLNQRQRHLEKLYIGKKGQEAFFKVFEKHLGKMFDTRTGTIGAIGWILGKMGTSYNQSLEKKMEKKLGIKPENFRKIYEETKKQLEKNKLQFEKIEYEEANHMGKSVEEFRKSGEYTTFASDIFLTALSLGVNAVGLSTGISFPLTHISFKRQAFAMDANAVLKHMNEGISYTDAIKKVSEETDASVFMAQNLMRNANILIAGPEGRNLAHLDKRWDNFQTMKSHLTFDKNKYNVGDIEYKNIYESMGFVIDTQGLVHFKESKKYKNIIYSLGERFFGNRHEKKQYKLALKTLKKTPKKEKFSEKEIIRLNQEKIRAIKTILELIKQENAEDFLRKSSRKNKKQKKEFKQSQMFGGVINEDQLKKKYIKHPQKMEGRIASVRQLERFLASQKNLVKNQREFFNIRMISSSKPTEILKKSDILYKSSIFGILSSFSSARELIKNFPIIPKMEIQNGKCVLPQSEHKRQIKIVTMLHKFYKEKYQLEGNELKILDKMANDKDFQRWGKEIGEWSNLQKNDPRGYQNMQCMEKIAIDTIRIKNKQKENKKEYEYNSVVSVAPYGAKKIPIGLSTNLFGKIGKFNIGTKGQVSDKVRREIHQITQTIKDPLGGGDILIPVDSPVDISYKEVISPSDIDTIIAHGGWQAAGLIGGLGGVFQGKTNAEKKLRKDRSNRDKSS